MINNAILEGYLNCKYKPFLILSGRQGIKNEYEIMQSELLEKYKSDFKKGIIKKYGEKSIIDDFEFSRSVRKKGIHFSFDINIKNSDFDITFDAIQIVNGKIFPILLVSDEKVYKKEKMILSSKCLILKRIFGLNNEEAKIYFGNDFKTIKIKLNYFLSETTRFLEDLEKIYKKVSEPLPYKHDHCKICEFEEFCYSKLIEKDDLSLLSSIREREKLGYEKKGIFTVKQLSYTFNPKKRGKRVKTKETPYYSSLKALALRDNKVYLYDKLEMPAAKTKVFIDVEGNSDGSSVYLIGIHIFDNDNIKTHSLWADNLYGEKALFMEFLSILGKLNDAHIFYYGKYELKIFKRIISTLKINKEISDLLLYKSTNILDVIYKNIYFPTYSNSLKDIGKYLGCSWSIINSSGIQSIVWRRKWDMSKDLTLKKRLIEYNSEDCVALKIITDFIYKIFSKESYGDEESKNISLVKDIKDNEDKPWLDKKFVSEDIEVITKCAYFEYQRNKIFFRTNENIKKIKRQKPVITKKKYKSNKIINYYPKRCFKCHNSSKYCDRHKLSCRTCFDLHISPYGIKKNIISAYDYPYICKRYVTEKDPSNPIRFPKFGHNLISWAMHQHVAYQISMENIARIALDYFGLPLDNRQIWRFKIAAARYYKDTYEEILNKIIGGNFVHVDETKVNFQKGSGYVWVFTNMEQVYYLYRPTRKSYFLHPLLKDFKGILISDFYSGYDSLNCNQQKCLIHLIRDLNNALLKNPQDDELKEIVVDFGGLLRKIMNTVDKHGLKKKFLHKHKTPVNIFFNKLKKNNLNSETADKFKKRFLAYQNELFTFLEFDNIPWNNNNAEHAIKHFAKYRSDVNGRLSAQGSEAYLILLSIYQTCKYKGVNFLDFLLSREKDIDLFIERCKNKKYRSKIRQ